MIFDELRMEENRFSDCHHIPGSIGANYQNLGKKFTLCFLDSHVIGITGTMR